MSNKPIKILFVCVKKGVRASIAKSIMNFQGNGKIQAAAASFEKGSIPQLLEQDITRLVEMSTDEVCKTIFEWQQAGTRFDYVITLCDESEEQCAILKKTVHSVYSHTSSFRYWSIPNLAKAMDFQGDDRAKFVTKVIGKIAVEVDSLIEVENFRIWDGER